MCQVNHSKAVYLDAVDIDKYGLNGKIECGNMRMQTPTGFAIYSNFIEMFYGNTDYDKLYKDYFETLYGKEQKISTFLEETSKLIPYEFINGKQEMLSDEEKEDLAKIPELIDNMAQWLSEYIPEETFCRKHCAYFGEFLDILKAYVLQTQAISDGADDETHKKFNDVLAEAIYKAESVMPDYIAAIPMKTRVCL